MAPTDSLPTATGTPSVSNAPSAPAIPTAPSPSGGDHGASIFNSPSTNRATTGALNGGLSRDNYGGSNSLGDRAASALNGSGAPGGSMKGTNGGSPKGIGSGAGNQAAKYKAQAGKDFGNAKAYRKNRAEAAAHGVKLAAYSSLRKKNSSGPAPS